MTNSTKEHERVMIKKDNKYQKLVENMPDAFAYHQIIRDNENNPVDYIFIEVNAAFETVSSLSRDSLIGKKVTEVDLSIQGDSFDWIGTYRKVATKGESIRFEEYFEIADKWYNITAYSNNAGYFATIFSDVTENKKVIEALQNSEKRYRRLFESARDGILILDANTGKVVDANPLLIELSGHSYDSIREKYIWEIDLFKEIAPSIDAFKTLQSKEYIRYEDLPLETKDGPLPVEFVSNVYLVDSRKVIQYNIRDITERKNTEKFIQTRLNLLKFAFENSLHAVLQKSLDEVCDITGSRIGVYYFVSDEEKMLTLKAWSTDSMQYIHKMGDKGEIRYSVDDAGIWGDCVRERRPIIHNDYISLPHHSDLTRGHVGITRELGIPIIRQGRIVAILVVGNKPQDYTDKDIQIASYFADIVWEIVEHKKIEEELKQSEEKFRTYTKEAPLGIFVADDKGHYIEVNLAACKMTGYTEEELLNLAVQDFMAPEFLDKGLTMFEKGLTEGFADGDVMVRNKNGNIFWIDLFSVKLSDNKIIAFCKDITDRKKSEEEILHISYHDHLTGLYNRRFYEEELKRLDTKRNLPLTIALGDINGLKLVNDSFGHEVGDKLLMKVAEVIKRECRGDDIVARLGGDEFIILLPKTNTFAAEKIIKRIQEQLLHVNVTPIDISISFGYGTKNSEEDNIQNIFKIAEDYMYKNKLYESLSTRSQTIELIMNTLFEKSNREQLHSKRVSDICTAIATKMGFNKDAVNQIRTAGLMHDIGKIGINEDILNKKQKLNSDEWRIIEKHPEIGYRILASVNEFSEIAIHVLQHQEKWNGKGYPKGLKGEEISLQARVIAIADAYDAMTGNRTYRTELSEEEAIAEIRRCSGTQFDPDIARVFIEKVLGKEWTSSTEVKQIAIRSRQAIDVR